MKIFSVVIKIWIDNLPCTRGRLDAALLGFEKNPKLAGINGVALTNALKLFIKCSFCLCFFTVSLNKLIVLIDFNKEVSLFLYYKKQFLRLKEELKRILTIKWHQSFPNMLQNLKS